MAPAEVRKGLDRRLWADATERLLDLQTTDDFQSALGPAERAGTLFRKSPTLASRLIDKAVQHGPARPGPPAAVPR